MTKTFNVGDKVRILDVSAIDYGDKYWENGDVVEVALVEYGEPLMLGTKPGYTLSHMYISEEEFHAIELVEETPKLTKKARIEALEKASKEQADFNEATADDFADLFGRVEALERKLGDDVEGDNFEVGDVIIARKTDRTRHTTKGKSYVIGARHDNGNFYFINDNFSITAIGHDADYRKVAS